ncbi:hypothetical protein JAAARDRAFT_70783 [Jaapia argillacea MUCL 33604]|uniref:Pentacotripeptide-repeat region of PRORP domain-containing protein n=1 Tax=Jaapia argillacea MUCL 33604 TaxID=933084 RepID=A0A067PXD2_9AGAM|nr:hypothetical protein JAAARDRAFT_70783 [Jaapia argillacea MUCL 33604]
MSNYLLLPPGLLDLTVLRLSSRVNTANRGLSRGMHQMVLRKDSVPQRSLPREADSQSLYQNRRRRQKPSEILPVKAGEALAALDVQPSTEVARRIQDLQRIAAAEEGVIDTPEYSEEDLLAIYENLLALPISEPRDAAVQEIPHEELDRALVDSLHQRLKDVRVVTSPDSSLSQVLRQDREVNQDEPQDYAEPETLNQHPYTSAPQIHRRLIPLLGQLVQGLESVKTSVESSNLEHTSAETASTSVPVGLVSEKEWKALARTCVRENDGEAAEMVLDLMMRLQCPPSEDLLNDVMDVYASQGDVVKTEAFMSKSIIGVPTPLQRDLHIKSHITSTPPATIPSSALSILHSYESQATPAPMRTYTRLITSLFTLHSSIARAQAWDLFTHMRYVAHPNPDDLLYTVMIRACASSAPSLVEPERALDLFTEMTIDKGIEPTRGAYNAVILACARSGEKHYVHEAFRLAKEMLEGWRDALGVPRFIPDKKTFSGLLEGAKRLGDLGRVRWILAEMVKATTTTEAGVEEVEVDEEIMMHVFHAYSAYNPPFRRSETVIVDEGDPGGPSAQNQAPDQASGQEKAVSQAKNARFSHIPPQSHAEVIAEVDLLFSRIIEDTSPAPPEDPTFVPPPKIFKDVTITPRLINSYLSVHYSHAPLQNAQDLFHRVFKERNVEKTPRTLVEALEKCAIARRGRDRLVALRFAQEVWTEWKALADGLVQKTEEGNATERSSIRPRLVERAYAAMIRTLARGGIIEPALLLVKQFVTRYPPTALRKPSPKPAMRSTRTVLTAPRPLVRMTSVTEVPDDTVPPLLTFSDLEVLHHRLVHADHSRGLAYLTWVCKSYEGSLRHRRDKTMLAHPLREGTSSSPSDTNGENQEREMDNEFKESAGEEETHY